MFYKIIDFNNKIYRLKLNMRHLIDIKMLSQNYPDQELNKAVFFLSFEDNIPHDEKKQIYYSLADRDDVVKEIIRISIGDDSQFILSEEDITRLFSLVVGEMGINYNDFYKMSPVEILFSYKGFIQNKERNFNLLTAIKNNKTVTFNNKYIKNSDKQEFFNKIGQEIKDE